MQMFSLLHGNAEAVCYLLTTKQQISISLKVDVFALCYNNSSRCRKKGLTMMEQLKTAKGNNPNYGK